MVPNGKEILKTNLNRIYPEDDSLPSDKVITKVHKNHL